MSEYFDAWVPPVTTTLYTLAVSYHDSMYDYVLKSTSDTFCVDTILLDGIFGDVYRKGDSNQPFHDFTALSAQAFDASGTAVEVDVINGGYYPGRDFVAELVRGTLFYADGVTPISDATVEVVNANGIRHGATGLSREDGSYSVYSNTSFGSGEEATATLGIRACFGRGCGMCIPGSCGYCSQVIEEVLDFRHGFPPIELDLVVPVAPASPTPTITNTPTASPTPTSTSANARSDLNLDGVTNDADLFVFQEYWHHPGDLGPLKGSKEADDLRLGNIALLSCPLKSMEGSWVAMAPMPTVRTSVGVGVVGEEAFVFGGYSLDTVDVFRPATNSWTTRAPMPTIRQAPAVGVVNGKIYVVGGGQPGSIFLGTNEMYDPSINAWQSKTSMPTSRWKFGIGVVDGKIYAIGGARQSAERVSTVEVYDPVTDYWCPRSPMPTARSSIAVGVVNGKIYVMGGRDNSAKRLDVVEEYCPETDTWSTRSPMPTARDLLASGVLGGSIYAIGGTNNDWNKVGANEVYDPVLDTWTSRAPMPTARRGLGIGVLHGKIYAIGGNGNPKVDIATNEEYTPPINTPTPTVTATATPTFDEERPNIDGEGDVNALDLLILLNDWKKETGS